MMYDPNEHKRFSRKAAEDALGIDDEARAAIKASVSIELLLAHAGITDDQIDLAYNARLKNQLADVRDAFGTLVGDEDEV